MEIHRQREIAKNLGINLDEISLMPPDRQDDKINALDMTLNEEKFKLHRSQDDSSAMIFKTSSSGLLEDKIDESSGLGRS
jgi:hypothetical protein